MPHVQLAVRMTPVGVGSLYGLRRRAWILGLVDRALPVRVGVLEEDHVRYHSRARLPSWAMCPSVVAVSKSLGYGWRYCPQYISGSTVQKVSVSYMSIWGGRVSIQCCQTSSC